MSIPKVAFLQLVFAFIMLMATKSYCQITVKNGTSLAISPNTTLILQTSTSDTLKIEENSIVINNGIIILGSNNSVKETPNFPISGSGYELAYRQYSFPVTSEDIAGLGFSLSSTNIPGETILKRGHTDLGTGVNSVLRWFDYQPEFPAPFDVQFYFDSTELNGNNSSYLRLMSSGQSNFNWYNYGGVANSFNFHVDANTIDSVGYFTLSPFLVELSQLNADTFCVAEQLDLDFMVTGLANSGNEFILELSDEFGDFANPNSLDTISGLISGTFSALIPIAINTSEDYLLRIRSTNIADTFLLQPIAISAYPLISFSGPTVFCKNDPAIAVGVAPLNGILSGAGIINSFFYPAIADTGLHNIYYEYSNSYNCLSNDSTTYNVNPLPDIAFNLTVDTICESAPSFQLNGVPQVGYFWGNGITNNTFDPTTSGSLNQQISFSYTSSLGCSDTITKQIYVRPKPFVTFNGLASTYCENDLSSSLIPTPVGGVFSGTGILFNSEFHPPTAGPGIFTINYFYEDQWSCFSNYEESTTVYFAPDIPIISQNNNMLASNLNGNLQWFFNGNAISGANGQFYEALQSGFYSVEITNNYACSSISELYNFNLTDVSVINNLSESIIVFPNPLVDQLYLKISNEQKEDMLITVSSIEGIVLFKKEIKAELQNQNVILNLAHLAAGRYILILKSDSEFITKSIIKL